MRKTILLAAASNVAALAFADTCETVMAKLKGGKEYVRVNKSDVDANPDNYTVSDAKTEAANSEPTPETVATPINPPPGVEIPPAPSAPAFDAPAPGVVPPGPVPPTTPSPNQFLVLKDKSKFYVVNGKGERIEDNDGIDKAGYKSEADAWAAIRALPH